MEGERKQGKTRDGIKHGLGSRLDGLNISSDTDEAGIIKRVRIYWNKMQTGGRDRKAENEA
jgi:hypothetical protein